jgi:hypothetical protein
LGTLFHVRYVGSRHLSIIVVEITMTYGVVEKNKKVTAKSQENPVENHHDVENRPDVGKLKKN